MLEKEGGGVLNENNNKFNRKTLELESKIDARFGRYSHF